jgi:hypothetical protein
MPILTLSSNRFVRCCNVFHFPFSIFHFGEFSYSGRVKGAWWPSPSSKRLLRHFVSRGRFDSYPLRHFLVAADGRRRIWRLNEPPPPHVGAYSGKEVTPYVSRANS